MPRTNTSNILGSALSFNGAGKVTIATTSAQNSLTNVTISLWVYLINISSGGGFPRIFQKGNTSVGYLDLSFDNSNTRLQFNTANATTNLQVGVARPSLLTWHHIVVTNDGSGLAANTHIYIDNSEPAYTLSTNAVGSRTADASFLTLGNRQSDTTRGITGYLDDFRLYNRVLNSTEITTLFNKGDIQSGLVYYAPFDYPLNNNTVTDFSSSNTSGSITAASYIPGIVNLNPSNNTLARENSPVRTNASSRLIAASRTVVPIAFLLLETGSYLLLQNGGKIII